MVKWYKNPISVRYRTRHLRTSGLAKYFLVSDKRIWLAEDRIFDHGVKYSRLETDNTIVTWAADRYVRMQSEGDRESDTKAGVIQFQSRTMDTIVFSFIECWE